MAQITYSLTKEELAILAAAEECPEGNEAFRKLTKSIPPIYKPSQNPGVHGILEAIAQGDCRILDQIPNVKDQLFVDSATLQYLDRLGANVGVPRPSGVGMKDADYRSLIPVMSYLPKQLRVTIQQLLKIWYGPNLVQANVVSVLPEPYSFAAGQKLVITTEAGEFTWIVEASDFLTPGAATAAQVVDAINRRQTDIEADVFVDPISFQNFVLLRTKVIGPTGWIQITPGVITTELDLPTTKRTITSLSKAAVVYEVNNQELVVLLPSSPAVVSRHLKGALYLNANADGSIKAGYIFDRKAKYSISGLKTTTTVTIQQGTVKPNVLVNPLPASWPSEPGYFIVDFGRATEEGPIRFLAAPNSGNLVIDPGYVFEFDHAIGATIRYVRSLSAPSVQQNGTSYAGYVTGLATARLALESLILAATAVGVVVRFRVGAPSYKFSKPALNVNAAV